MPLVWKAMQCMHIIKQLCTVIYIVFILQCPNNLHVSMQQQKAWFYPVTESYLHFCMPSHKICIPLTGAIHCCTPSKAVNILHHACRAKATLAKWYQCFAAPAIIHAMPERLANKRFRVDFISTAELAPAFAAGVKVIELSGNAALIERFF